MSVSGEVILRGLHWASGILTEIVGDYGNVMPTAARDLLRESLANLHEAQDAIRRHDASRCPARRAEGTSNEWRSGRGDRTRSQPEVTQT